MKFSLPNDANLNNFHCEILAEVTASHAVHTVHSGAIWRMKEQHCGLFSGKASIALPHRPVQQKRVDNNNGVVFVYKASQ